MICWPYASNNAGRSDTKKIEIETLLKVIEPNPLFSMSWALSPTTNYHHHHCREASTKCQRTRLNSRKVGDAQGCNAVIFRDSVSHEWKYCAARLSKSRYPTYWASWIHQGMTREAWFIAIGYIGPRSRPTIDIEIAFPTRDGTICKLEFFLRKKKKRSQDGNRS